MADQPFPWLRTPGPTEVADESAPPLIPTQTRWHRYKKFMPYMGLAALLVVLFVTRGGSATVTAPAAYDVDVLVTMTPVTKGGEIIPETLKEIPIEKKSLSKVQLLQIVRYQDVEGLKGRLVAKKTLPPNKPMFWSDLDVIPLTKNGGIPAAIPTLVFSKEN